MSTVTVDRTPTFLLICVVSVAPTAELPPARYVMISDYLACSAVHSFSHASVYEEGFRRLNIRLSFYSFTAARMVDAVALLSNGQAIFVYTPCTYILHSMTELGISRYLDDLINGLSATRDELSG